MDNCSFLVSLVLFMILIYLIVRKLVTGKIYFITTKEKLMNFFISIKKDYFEWSYFINLADFINFILAVYLMVFWNEYLDIEIKFSFRFIFNVFCSVVLAFVYLVYFIFILFESYHFNRNKKEIYLEPY
jgi:hypothetical protein